jgi:hypothetical protein
MAQAIVRPARPLVHAQNTRRRGVAEAEVKEVIV